MAEHEFVQIDLKLIPTHTLDRFRLATVAGCPLLPLLVDDADNVWLTGFGIASQLPHERQVPAPPEVIAGTLAYMAPEQTGRMNRSIDARSDLYSLGVTLYQMLTGVLPFDAADPLEWVHCHIARQPTPPGDRAEVPEPLSAIVVKLLAKNAEERYQTACGLEADLRRCLGDWQSRGRINTFPLSGHDASDRLLIPEKLYRRKREVDTLLAAFDRVVAQGTPELVLVSGYSGVGKSSVVNELHKVLVPPRGLFASGKFDQYKRDIPYTTLAQAFQTLIHQILVKSEAEVAQWRRSLQEGLGPNGQLIVNLIPEVEFLIGKQPPAPVLPPQDAQNRFQLVFRRFLSAFARPEHPLALFLDDLQWLDTATLELLEHVITDPDVRHLMLVGASRAWRLHWRVRRQYRTL
jgi:serine/threonine protein kinase